MRGEVKVVFGACLLGVLGALGIGWFDHTLVSERRAASATVKCGWAKGYTQRVRCERGEIHSWPIHVVIDERAAHGTTPKEEENRDVLGDWLANLERKEARAKAEAAWEQRKREYREKANRRSFYLPDECSYSRDLDIYTWEEVQRMEWYCVQDLRRFDAESAAIGY